MTYLHDPLFARLGIPKTIYVTNPHSSHDGAQTPRKSWRRAALEGEVIRPVGTYYIHNGRKPK
jgi:hypothetical protein